jgi:predicted Zn-dependent protease
VRVIALILSFVMMAAPVLPALAQGRSKGPSVIRDAEIEHTLRTYAEPLLDAAGLSSQAVRIIIIDDRVINAFVSGGQNLFFYTGLLRATDTAGQLYGVMAHEIGHIAGGHLIAGQAAMANASRLAMITGILGLAAGAATGHLDAGMAATLGGMSSAQSSMMAFTREQEASADTAALKFLDANGLSAEGMADFLDKLLKMEGTSSADDAFWRSHPLTSQRVNQVRAHVADSPYAKVPDPPEWAENHARMVAKLDGFIDPDRALVKYPASDTSFAGRYGRAIALYRTGKISDALTLLDSLIKLEPDNPFLYELRGQILFENGRGKEALAPYARSVSLMPDSDLLQQGYAHALVEDGAPENLTKAVDALNRAIAIDGTEPFTWHLLAVAEGRLGHDGLATVALSEESLLNGNLTDAEGQAKRAQALLPAGSQGALRAEDVLTEVSRQKALKKN